MRRATGVAIVAAAVATCFSLAGCKRTPKIDGLRDALAQDDPGAAKSATEGLAACGELPPVALAPGEPSPRDKGCLSEIANTLGSQKGYVVTPPDQAAAATVAVIIARDKRGDWIAHSSVWLAAIKIGTGAGIDALRLAIATAMVEGAPLASKKLEGEADQRATLKMVASTIPGACPTYWLLGTGADPKTLAAPLSAEHASCVHGDLAGPSGPGPSYGSGVPRALEGSLALWRETAGSLRRGLDRVAAPVRPALEKKLAIIDAATAAIIAPKVESAAPSSAMTYLSDLHADAGIFIDAGEVDAAAAVDSGPRAVPDAGAAAKKTR
jgi:hypothetical protein